MSTAPSESMVQAVITQPEEIVSVILGSFDADQLRELVLELATRLRPAPVEGTPEGICAEAGRRAALHFGVAPTALVSRSRSRAITDARAVAQAAARRCSLTLPAIAAQFGQDHSSVVHSVKKVAAAPELDAIAQRIADDLVTLLTATSPSAA